MTSGGVLDLGGQGVTRAAPATGAGKHETRSTPLARDNADR